MSFIVNRLIALVEGYWQKKLDGNLPIPPKTLAANRATQHSILKHLTEKEYLAKLAPQAAKDLPLGSFDPGVFDNELLQLKLYSTLDPKDPARALAPEGNIRQGTYAGTQVALTQAYSRIEQTYASNHVSRVSMPTC